LRAAQSAGYLSYSEADFEVFHTVGATRCTDVGEIWHEGGGLRRWLSDVYSTVTVPSSVPNFTDIGAAI